ncbi:hypothetical protein ABIE66_004778 [Peribacillus sp. B2I2]
MGISIVIIFSFILSLIFLIIGLMKKQRSIIIFSSILLVLSLGLGAFIFELIGYM